MSLTTLFHKVVSRLAGVPRSDGLRRSTTNAFYSSVETLFVPLLWIISTPIFYSRLGANRYGLWILVNGIMGFGGLMSYGLTEATVKFISERKGLGDTAGVTRILGVSLSMCSIIGSVLAGILFFAAAPLVAHVFNIHPEDRDVAVLAVKLGAAGILVRFISNTFRSAILGFERYDTAARISMLTAVAITVVNVLQVLMGRNIIAVITASISITALAALVMPWLLVTRLQPGLRIGFVWSRAAWREVMGFGFFTWLRSIVAALGQNVDVLIVASLVDTSAVGYYTVSSRITWQIHTVLARAFAFLFPLAGRLTAQGNTRRIQVIYGKTALLLGFLAGGLYVPFYVLAEPLLSIWMGPEFGQQAAPVLRIFCIIFSLLPLSILNYYFLLGMGHARALAMIDMLRIPSALLGMLVMIPAYGITGAAMGQAFGLPVMLAAYVYVAGLALGRQARWAGLSYIIPAIVPLACGSLLMLYWQPSVHHAWQLAAGLVLTAGAGWALSWIARIGIMSGGWTPHGTQEQDNEEV